VDRRKRIVTASVIGGLLVLAGMAFFFRWMGWMPLWCFVPLAACETVGTWLLVRTLGRNARSAREGREERSIIPFGVAVFLILFGAGIVLATFKLIPDVAWGVGVLLISLGGTYIYRGVVLPNSNGKKKQESSDERSE
jgi:hypothetical protein